MQNLLQNIKLQKLNTTNFNGIDITVVRLDLLHTIVSGNKWYKLQLYLQDAKQQQKTIIATFGGAYSNHIVATAFACQQNSLQSIGFIRGEEPKQLSHTLLQAKNFGMQLKFVSRNEYKNKSSIIANASKNWYAIDEGGYGILGMLGAAKILDSIDNLQSYTHIICSCGTGTTMAGLITSAMPHQIIMGISALKGNNSLETDIKNLLPNSMHQKNIQLLHDYHFGGYAKHPKELLEFMNILFAQENLPTDIVYTGKLLYAVKHLCNNSFFDSNHKVLVLHTGGLQGNLSLPKNTLNF